MSAQRKGTRPAPKRARKSRRLSAEEKAERLRLRRAARDAEKLARGGKLETALLVALAHGRRIFVRRYRTRRVGKATSLKPGPVPSIEFFDTDALHRLMSRQLVRLVHESDRWARVELTKPLGERKAAEVEDA